MIEYKDIYFTQNPWKYGQGEYQEMLAIDNEPELIVYTPDIERYCETTEQAKNIIDNWLEENGDLEIYRFKQDMKIGINRLSIIPF